MCFKNVVPEPEPGIESHSATQNAAQLWSCVMTGTGDLSVSEQPTDFTVEMMNIIPFGSLNLLHPQHGCVAWWHCMENWIGTVTAGIRGVALVCPSVTTAMSFVVSYVSTVSAHLQAWPLSLMTRKNCSCCTLYWHLDKCWAFYWFLVFMVYHICINHH